MSLEVYDTVCLLCVAAEILALPLLLQSRWYLCTLHALHAVCMYCSTVLCEHHCYTHTLELIVPELNLCFGNACLGYYDLKQTTAPTFF
jgi:hypothetical protein